METPIERELVLDLVLSPERSIAVPARLAYHVHDPYAVHITFDAPSDSPVRWSFARELLSEGLSRPCGQGDVRVWPATVEEGRGVVCVALSSPTGDALLRAPAAPVAAWLERTLRAVPAGREGERLGLEEGLGRLLAAPSDGTDEAGL
ncbi:SsgA family sporulation/cell division regulator [Streptomyces sp. TRM43335]|uniref:SsgA family sporulation/cell division regulator n=1 Tax=Streptomyces taklimakanensis TaxID=2569853 RepID=A0A6G2BAD1_9ACTN|nr:SsgA family sporulation/cell division regulator [Streptomyces taklimakanensis]MTE19231.1 SsgA family sporulation/cell division regulator [Streptomyces taklimakanensis]